MCLYQITSKVKVAKKPFTVYKVTDLGKSYYAPYRRERQINWPGRDFSQVLLNDNGTVINYECGERYKSPLSTTPGFYCYTENPKRRLWFERIYKCTVPAGASYFKGRYSGRWTVNASEIIVNSIVKMENG